jgi:hypothetical protein
MRSRSLGLFGTVMVSMSMLARPIVADEAGTCKRPIPILASPVILSKGTACQVDLKPEAKSSSETVTMSYRGTIVKADDAGVMLSVSSGEEKRIQKAPHASKIPLLGRLFTNIGIHHTTLKEKTTIWIPVETISRPSP